MKALPGDRRPGWLRQEICSAGNELWLAARSLLRRSSRSPNPSMALRPPLLLPWPVAQGGCPALTPTAMAKALVLCSPRGKNSFVAVVAFFFFCYFFVFFFFPPVATATTSHLLSGQLGLAGQPESPSGPWAGCGPGQRKARAGSPSPPLGPAAAVPGLDGVRVPRLRRCPSGGCISPSCCRWCEVPPKQPIQPSCVFTRGYW